MHPAFIRKNILKMTQKVLFFDTPLYNEDLNEAKNDVFLLIFDEILVIFTALKLATFENPQWSNHRRPQVGSTRAERCHFWDPPIEGLAGHIFEYFWKKTGRYDSMMKGKSTMFAKFAQNIIPRITVNGLE